MEAEDGSSLRVASFSCYLDTAKESLVHRVSAQDNNISIKFSKNKDPSAALRVDSFSRSSDHNLLFQVPAPIQDPTSAFTFSHHHTPKHPAEIGVFGADRYFNMKLDYQTANTQLQPPLRPHPRPRPRPPTPTTLSLCSEATSTTWNSQTTLLPNEMKPKKAGLFMGLGCRSAPCFDKKSVHVDEIVVAAPAPAPAKNHDLIKKIQDLEESRRSIEVFGSRRQRPSKGGDVATNMERKLSMLTWDAIPTGRNNLPTSTIGSCDVASDASSDLFEIEDVSGTIFPLLEASAGDIDDAASGCMSPATSLYAPSEASIQWSVVTASAADYSAPSEFNDDSVSAAGKAVKMITRNHPVQVVQRASRPSGLLGCKSVKAVDVADQNVCVKISKD